MRLSRLLSTLTGSALFAWSLPCFGQAKVLPEVPAAPATETPGPRRQKPWLLELGLGLPRFGAGLYYHFSDHWALGGHLMYGTTLAGIYSVSGRYYFTKETVSFFLEPSLGMIPVTYTDYRGDPGIQRTGTTPGWLAALELGMNYRYDFGLNLEFSVGIMASRLEVPSVSSFSPAFALAAGWAF